MSVPAPLPALGRLVRQFTREELPGFNHGPQGVDEPGLRARVRARLWEEARPAIEAAIAAMVTQTVQDIEAEILRSTRPSAQDIRRMAERAGVQLALPTLAEASTEIYRAGDGHAYVLADMWRALVQQAARAYEQLAEEHHTKAARLWAIDAAMGRAGLTDTARVRELYGPADVAAGLEG